MDDCGRSVYGADFEIISGWRPAGKVTADLCRGTIRLMMIRFLDGYRQSRFLPWPGPTRAAGKSGQQAVAIRMSN